MSFLTRLFTSPKHQRIVQEPVLPDDSALVKTMSKAKEANRTAVDNLVKASKKQERDAIFARHVVAEVLARADNMKDMKNAGIQK